MGSHSCMVWYWYDEFTVILRLFDAPKTASTVGNAGIVSPMPSPSVGPYSK